MTAVHPSLHTMETASGRFLNLLDPDPDAFVLEDVARGLSRTCRYGGHTRIFYSVAEHAWLVAWRLVAQGHGPSVALAGLHHDDAEAYIGDITRPVAMALPAGAKKGLEATVFEALTLGLGLADLPFDEPAIKATDEWALSAEAYHLMPSQGRGWFCEGYFDPERDEFPLGFLGFPSLAAEDRWLDAHQRLLKEIR